jgi:hypothetical protein
MEENPYKAPVESPAQTPGDGKWSRRLRRWSHGQPLELFYLVLIAVGVFLALVIPLWQRLSATG